jgi:hypothetical protein
VAAPVSPARVGCRVLVLALSAVVLLAAAAPTAAAPSHGLQTGVLLFGAERTAAVEPTIFDRVRGAGGTHVRLFLVWSSVAPGGSTKPTAFDAANPADPHYRWSDFDREIRLARDKGLVPIVDIYGAPRWAEGEGDGMAGTVRPDAGELGLFARAAALRYGGSFLDLPRVRNWMVWNEPNLHLSLNPQFEAGQPASPTIYRRLVNAMADAVKAVHPDNLVVAGGTAPFRDLSITHTNWGPLGFMRELLCLGPDLKPKCAHRVRFDVWSHHPYTSGGPTRSAVLPDDVSMGDLAEMRTVLHAGVAAGNVLAEGPLRFWVTEFSWDSSPPDPRGVPLELLKRWTAEALFHMWRQGVDLLTWLSVRDFPLDPTGLNYQQVQAGLYFRGATLAEDQPKPHLQSFRFPFVAFPAVDGVRVWGRTPAGRQANVVVQQRFKGGWTELGTLTSDQHGIVQGRLAGSAVAHVRARTADLGEESAEFAPRPEPDRTFTPHGGAQLEPDRPPLPVSSPPTVPPRPSLIGSGAPKPSPPPVVPARPAG